MNAAKQATMLTHALIKSTMLHSKQRILRLTWMPHLRACGCESLFADTCIVLWYGGQTTREIAEVFHMTRPGSIYVSQASASLLP